MDGVGAGWWGGNALEGKPRDARHRSCGQKRSQTESAKELDLSAAEIECFRHEVTASLLPVLVCWGLVVE